MITIGGMALGIATIVFLVSLGYGIQKLVVSRVARLEEMEQTDVTPQPGGKIKIDDKTLSDLRNIPEVEKATPMIALVSKVVYNSSIADVAAYGVTTDYLSESAIKPSKGELYQSYDEVLKVEAGTVKGIKTVKGINNEWVIIDGESDSEDVLETKIVEIPSIFKKEAVVNRSMLRVLGLEEHKAIGEKFQATFVVVGNLTDNTKEKIESAPTEYTIVGVVPEEGAAFFYVPFIQLRSLGVNNYSQIKVTVKNESNLQKVRKQIEAMGYISTSAVDTVEQIDSLFDSARSVLAIMGMAALAVASLGMFNTLTVSLLERTREVGLMKTMGMKSHEIQELFLIESTIMGLIGGLLGIFLGWLFGKGVGLVLSAFAVYKDQGMISVTYIPFSFLFVVLLLSFLIGIFTGLYPAKRAKRISALDALRYE